MLTPTGFEGKRTVAVLGSWFWIVVLGDRDSGDRDSAWDRAVFLFLDFIGAYGIFNNRVKYVDGYI